MIREEIEKREKEILSPFACLSAKSRGRARAETECPYRTAYQRDRDRVIHCKSFRRLKHKTQVFISPAGDHYRTRLTHTLEVSQIARTLARALRLNEDLTEAIALAHDLGHTPFGHAGEEALREILKGYGAEFHHNLQSVRVVEVIEKDGKGLNLTGEVIDGIAAHRPQDPTPQTLEGQLVRLADRFAYLRHDIEDALLARVLTADQLPKEHMSVLGEKILDTLVPDCIKNNLGQKAVKMSPRIEAAMNGLYDFMYEHVYTNYQAKSEETKVPYLLQQLFRHYHYDPKFQKNIPESEQLRHTVDFIAGMTDRFAINMFEDLFVPSEWRTPEKE
ncbi:deoxyguanosinetriphosphate triphosphohydrolase [Candidatus Saganbacteria bacterium]|nr:deoxyguanosinetriphosphate triphosphohydrolase [Candidatus Saganbacteria bacterium]